MICRRKLINRTTHLQWFNLISVNLSAVDTGKRYIGHSVDLSKKSINNGNTTTIDKMSLASNLVCLVDGSSPIDERKPMNRLELKRYLELRIKKRVKDQYKNGKFHDLIEKVIANPYTLQDAYDGMRVNSKVNLSSECDNISFTSPAEELASGKFDISYNVFSISSRRTNNEKLVLPNLKTNVIQEAIRIALEVVTDRIFPKSLMDAEPEGVNHQH